MKGNSVSKETIRLVFSRIGWFLISGVTVLVIYLLVMSPLAPMLAAKIDPTDTKARSIRFIIVYLLFALFYIVPLYLFLFRNNVGLKTEILHIIENGFDLKTVFRAVYKRIGLLDHMIYTLMSIVLLAGRALGAPIIGFLMIQESGFYSLPIPEFVSFMLSVICFALQYAACLIIVSVNWNKNRLHRPDVKSGR